jgi:hypothetical protein
VTDRRRARLQVEVRRTFKSFKEFNVLYSFHFFRLRN